MGERNQKFFFLFLLYIFLSSLIGGVIVVMRMYQCGKYGLDVCNIDLKNPMPQILCGTLLIFESVLFGLFVVIMAVDQLNGIRKNQGGIDRLKGHVAKTEHQSTFSERFADVFGGGDFRWTWLLPVSPPFRLPEWYP